tara:strand:+ start:16124 stop:17590 length:1467 start_codon:yes stop_codon:yes gene_type:complete
MNKKKIGLILGPLLFILTKYLFYPTGLSEEANSVLASALWVAVWWITEAIPIAVTALLPIIIFPISGGLDLVSTTSSFGHKYIFLYIGGFIIAITIEKWNLHKRLALNIINLIGINIRKIILGFMIATAFLSMWISNTATTVMMLPIGLAIIKQLQDNPATTEAENHIFGKALMLAIAYSASIGGFATLIGTPPNLILAGVISEIYSYEITFFQWFMFGLPISVLMLFICWIYLTRYAFKFQQKEFPGGKHEIKRQLKGLGRITYEEKLIVFVFLLATFCWITRSFLLQKLIPNIDDTIIALIFSTVLFIIPSKDKKENLIKWEEAVQLPWGIILLFGGGMALANGFETSGLANWIGSQMNGFANLPLIIIVFLLIASVNFLTEITSNLATTAMLLPILAPMSLAINVHPFILMVGVAVSACHAFMLPVATPPNAIVFGSGYLSIPDMVKTGFSMNLISIIILTMFVYYILPILWNIVPDQFPLVLQK